MISRTKILRGPSVKARQRQVTGAEARAIAAEIMAPPGPASSPDEDDLAMRLVLSPGGAALAASFLKLTVAQQRVIASLVETMA